MNGQLPDRVGVLHLHSGNMMGGIESLLLTIAGCRDLTPEIQHEFALTFDADFARQLRERKAKVHLLPEVRLRHLPSIRQARQQLRMLLREERFDVVVAHSAWVQLILGDIAREFRSSLVFWMHGAFDGHWLQKLASFHIPDFAICNSRWTRSTLERCYPRVPSAVIYAPVQAVDQGGDRVQLRENLGIRPEEELIVIAARMESWKGHADLLTALAKIKPSVSWRLAIAGAPNTASESAYFNLLQSQAASLGIGDRVQFLGFRSDVRALMAAADIYCQPNREPEPFGVVFVEALQAGVPVVTSRLGGAQEILDASTGLLVQAGDYDGLARALTLLLEDPILRRQLGDCGQLRVKELCDPDRQMRMIAETLQSVMQRARGISSS